MCIFFKFSHFLNVHYVALCLSVASTIHDNLKLLNYCRESPSSRWRCDVLNSEITWYIPTLVCRIWFNLHLCWNLWFLKVMQVDYVAMNTLRDLEFNIYSCMCAFDGSLIYVCYVEFYLSADIRMFEWNVAFFSIEMRLVDIMRSWKGKHMMLLVCLVHEIPMVTSNVKSFWISSETLCILKANITSWK